MKYLGDVWVNWFYGGSKKYNIPELFEWRKDDTIELMDQIPIVFVEPAFYRFVEEKYLPLPDELLELVEGKALIRKNNKRRTMNYSFIITDGANVLAVSTQETTEPVMKSRLIPRQDQMVLEQVKNMQVTAFDWHDPRGGEENDTVLDEIASLREEYMIGLTRRERDMKEILMDCVFSLGCSENEKEIRYWLIELHPELYGRESLNNMSSEDMLREIFYDLRYGWTENHFNFCDNLVKYYEVYKDLWEDAKSPKKLKTRQ